MDENKHNIFEEASKEAAKSIVDSPVDKTEELISRNEELALYISENPGVEFNKLKEAVEGPFAEKFMKIMNGLPDKDFIRYYLKTLEYFKPKVTRVEPLGSGEKEDNIINVNIMQVNDKGDLVSLKLNKETGGYEKSDIQE